MKHQKKYIFISLISAIFIASFNAHSKTQLTPSHIYNWAKTHNISRLYQFKKYINLYDKNQNTALCIAQQQHDKVSYSLLLKYGASTDVPCHIPLENFKEPPQPKQIDYTKTALFVIGTGATAATALSLEGGGSGSSEQCPLGYSTMYADVSSCGKTGSLGWTYESKGSIKGKPCGKCTPLTCKDNSSIEYTNESSCPTLDTLKATSVSPYGLSGDLNCYTCHYQCNPQNNSYSSPQDCKSDFNGNDCATTTTTNTNIGQSETITCYSPNACDLSIYDTPDVCPNNYTPASSCKDANSMLHHKCTCDTQNGYYSDKTSCLTDEHINNKGFLCDGNSSGCITRGTPRDCDTDTTTSTAQTYNGLVYVSSEEKGFSGENTCFLHTYKCDAANNFFDSIDDCKGAFTSCSPTTITTNENVTYSCYIPNTCDTSSWSHLITQSDGQKCPTGTKPFDTCTDTTGTYANCLCNESTYFSNPTDCENFYKQTGFSCTTSGYCHTKGSAIDCNKDDNYATKVENCGNGSNPDAWKLTNNTNGFSGGERCYKCAPQKCESGFAYISEPTGLTITKTATQYYSGYSPCYTYTAQCNTSNNYFTSPTDCSSAFPGNDNCNKITTQDISLLDTSNGSTETTQTLNCYTPNNTCDTTGWINPISGNTCGEGYIKNNNNYCKSLTDEFVDCICDVSHGYYPDATSCLNDENKNNKGYLCNGNDYGCITRGTPRDCDTYTTTSNAQTYNGLAYVSSEEKGFSGENTCFLHTYKCDEANNFFTSPTNCESKFTSCSSTTITTNENVTYTCYIPNTCDTSSWSNPQTNATENLCPQGTTKTNTCTDTTATYIDCPCNETSYFSDSTACENFYKQTGYSCTPSGYCHTQGNPLECNKANNSATDVKNCGDGTNPDAWTLSNETDGYSDNKPCKICAPASCPNNSYVSITTNSNVTITQNPSSNYSGYDQCYTYTAQCNTSNNYFATPANCLSAFPGNDGCNNITIQDISLYATSNSSTETTQTLNCYTPNNTCDTTGWINPISGNTCGTGFVINKHCKSLTDEFVDCICNNEDGYYDASNYTPTQGYETITKELNNTGYICYKKGNKSPCGIVDGIQTTTQCIEYTGLSLTQTPAGQTGEDTCYKCSYTCNETDHFANPSSCPSAFEGNACKTEIINGIECTTPQTCDTSSWSNPITDATGNICPQGTTKTNTCTDTTATYINCPCNETTHFSNPTDCENFYKETGYGCTPSGYCYTKGDPLECKDGFKTNAIDCTDGTTTKFNYKLLTSISDGFANGLPCYKCAPSTCPNNSYVSITTTSKILTINKTLTSEYSGNTPCYTYSYQCNNSSNYYNSSAECLAKYPGNVQCNTPIAQTITLTDTANGSSNNITVNCYQPSGYCDVISWKNAIDGNSCKDGSIKNGNNYCKSLNDEVIDCICDNDNGYYTSSEYTANEGYETITKDIGGIIGTCYKKGSPKSCPNEEGVQKEPCTSYDGLILDQTIVGYSGEDTCYKCSYTCNSTKNLYDNTSACQNTYKGNSCDETTIINGIECVSPKVCTNVAFDYNGVSSIKCPTGSIIDTSRGTNGYACVDTSYTYYYCKCDDSEGSIYYSSPEEYESIAENKGYNYTQTSSGYNKYCYSKNANSPKTCPNNTYATISQSGSDKITIATSDTANYSGETTCKSYISTCIKNTHISPEVCKQTYTNNSCDQEYSKTLTLQTTYNGTTSTQDIKCYGPNTCDRTIYPYQTSCPTQMNYDSTTGTCKDLTGTYINCLCNESTTFTNKDTCEAKTGYICTKDETYGCHYPTSEIIECNNGYATISINCGSSSLKGTAQNTGWKLTSENGQISAGVKCKKCEPIDCASEYSTTYQQIENCTTNRKEGWNTGWIFTSSGRSGDSVCGKCSAKSSCDVGYTACNTYSNLVLSKHVNKYYQGNNACYTCSYTCDENSNRFDSIQNCQNKYGENPCKDTDTITITTPSQTKTCYLPSFDCSSASYGDREFYSACPANTYMGNRYCKTPNDYEDNYKKECLCDTSKGYYSSTTNFPGWYANYDETSRCYTKSNQMKDCQTGYATEYNNSTCTTNTNKNGWTIDVSQTPSHFHGDAPCYQCVEKECSQGVRFPNGTGVDQCPSVSGSSSPWFADVYTSLFSETNYSGDVPCGACHYFCNTRLSSYSSNCTNNCVTLSYSNTTFDFDITCKFNANFCTGSTQYYTKEECEAANPEYYCKLEASYNGSDLDHYCYVPDTPSPSSSHQTFIGKTGQTGETIINPTDETISMQTFGDNTFIGMYTKTGGTAINEGKIEITGDTGTAIGILGDGQNTIENKGIINVSGQNAYGIKVIDGTGTSITNSGEINVSATSDAYGIYIEENGNLATVTNTGTISINSNLNDENNAIVLNGAELRNQNQFNVEGDLDIKSLQARAFVVERGSQITAQSVEGELTAGISTVQSDENKDQYVEENSVVANDTSNLEVKSESALFKASTQQNAQGNTNIVLDRKDFKEFTPNSSMGEYLNKNYQDGKFVDTFNSIKEATSAFDIASKSVKFMGADNMLNFVDENIQVLRGLNRNIAETILSPDKDEPYRVLSGAHNYSLETDDKGLLSGYDINSNSVYMFGDKRLNNWSRLGLGLSFTDINSSYEHGGSRDLSYVNIFIPYLYKLGPKLHLASILSFGYGYGDFERDSIHSSELSQFTYGLTNELRYTMDLNGFAELEPALILNALGYQEKGLSEGNDDVAIITKNNNVLSIEAGLGLFIKKEVKTSENSKLGFKVGGIYYHEFSSPYRDITARHRASNYWYKINDYANLYKRDRAVFESVIDYMYKDFSVYLKYNKLIQNNNPEVLDLGIKYNF